ncbi:MAG: site-specific integrase [Pseudomonadota bacterium]
MRFTTPSGELIRCSTKTADKTEAQHAHDLMKAESWRQDVIGEKPKYTWDDAAYKWLIETQHKKSHKDDVAKIRWLQDHFRGKLLTELTRDCIIAVAQKKRTEAADATVNRYLALIRAILRRARDEWEWIERAPKVKMYKEVRRRVRWITPDQVRALLAELMPHQRELTLFALATGLRQSNIHKLTWEHVDLVRRTLWIPGDKAKNGEDIHVSLSEFAVGILQRQLGKHEELVFTRAGHPISQVNTKSWRDAVVRAGIHNFRWHDLRHTWASWLVQNGTPLYDLQEMGAWKSADMVRRYAHLGPAQMARHAEVVGKLLESTNLAQEVEVPLQFKGPANS